MIAPVVLAAGFIGRPYVSDFSDNEVLATAIAAATDRWEIAGLLIAAGAGLLALALPAAVAQVDGGERRVQWVRVAATTWAVLLTLQVGLVSLGAAAASRTGADVVEFLDASSGLELSVLIVGLLAFAVAWIGVIRTAWTAALPSWMKWLVTVGGAFGALAPLYPASLGEYASALGIAAALWAIAARRSLEGIAASRSR